MLSVVLPVHCEEEILPELLERLTRSLDTIPEAWELIFVDDGSTDGSWDIIRAAAETDSRVRGLRLSRNFGHQVALSAGLAHARGSGVVTLDSDGQHPPEAIPALLDRAAEGHDVVYAIRSDVDGEGWLKIHSARVFYRLLNRLTSLDLPVGGGDFRYMSRRVVDVLNGMPERHRFLRGMSRWTGFSQSTVVFDRGARRTGRSKYTLRRMLRFGTDAIVSFSAVPLRIASVMGIVMAVLGGLFFLYTLGVRAFSDRAVAGWTSVMAAVLLLGGTQLVCLGILGQYLGRMYEEDKRRPLYLVWDDTQAATQDQSRS